MNNPWNLRPRQAEILSLLTGGMPCNKLIARHLGVSLRTVDGQLERAFKKMGVPNRTQAALVWDRWARAQA